MRSARASLFLIVGLAAAPASAAPVRGAPGSLAETRHQAHTAGIKAIVDKVYRTPRDLLRKQRTGEAKSSYEPSHLTMVHEGAYRDSIAAARKKQLEDRE